MKPWIKILIAGVIGFGGGFASGFLTFKKLNDVKFEEISEEEMAEIEKKVAEKQKTKEPETDIHVNDYIDTVRELPEKVDELRKALQGKTPYIQADNERKKAYEKMWNATKEYSNEDNANGIPTVPIVDPAEEEYPSEEDDIDEAEEENENAFDDPPHPISLSEFYNERPEYDKVTIDWYEPDDVWLDEKEEIIADIRSYIGIEVRGLFASNTPEDDPDIRFIRNDRYGSDYEVVRHHRSWWETSGGTE